MPDKRKRGRKSGHGTTLEKRVLRRYREILNHWRATYSSHGGYAGGETAHMQVAQEFHIPCQQVLDIVDPERKNQRARIAHYERIQRWRAYVALHRDENGQADWSRILDHPHIWHPDPHSPEPAVECADPECDAWLGLYGSNWLIQVGAEALDAIRRPQLTVMA